MKQIRVNYEFEVLLSLLKKEMHGRELAKELGTSLTRVQSILNDLRDGNVLDYRKVGKNHIYFIKKNIVSRSYVLSAENYKFVRVVSKHPFLEPLFEDIISKSGSGLIVLFGSYVKGNARKESDVDIYIEGVDEKVKKDVEKVSDLVSVKIGAFDKDALLVREIIKDHVIIKGGEEFYDKIGFFE
ncbi:MAG: nucleotidyltransferase domain-containing protein [Nanoarchaeota archaeon]|nr:nucleotidyltransferase domain-containing protein [Nanoarchaeota archaeon]